MMVKLLLFGAGVALGVGALFDILRAGGVADVPFGGPIAAVIGIAAMLLAAYILDKKNGYR